MKIFLFNLLLALVWLILTGELTVSNFVLGFAAGYVVLRVIRRALPDTAYFNKGSHAVGFGAFFLSELIKANLRVAHDVLTPRHHMKPGVIAIPLDVKSDEEIVLLANLVSLTPGTLSLDVSVEHDVLYVHAMYIDDVEDVRAHIKQGFERRVMRLMR